MQTKRFLTPALAALGFFFLALQLQFHLKMRLLGGGLMRSSPEGPGDNARWLDALLREPYGYAANFLN
jgi:hypothetical protein